MKKICLSFLIAVSFIASAQEINIIPNPAEIKIKSGYFLLDKNVLLVAKGNNQSELRVLDQFNEYLQKFYSFKLKTNNFYNEKEKRKQIIFGLIANNFDDKKADYILNVDKEKIYIISPVTKQEGLFYGLQTLIQLLPLPASRNQHPASNSLSIPQLSISDFPRFEYRGMHLDVCRHFFPVSFVKQYIDYLALHKFNKFHWHLTEDQGWRIQIKKYPKLTEVGAWRNGTIIGRYPGKGNDNIYYGGFYTQDEIKEVVRYAAERFIEVIPEIEMPGHGSAAIAAYPWLSCFPEKPTEIPTNMISQKSIEEQKNGRIKLVQETWGVFDDIFCAGKDSTFMFLQNVIDEVVPLFPSKYFHIGGDEAPKVHWKKCPRCQQRMKELGLKDEHELQSYFVQRIEKYLNSKGKTLIGWDEILEGGLAPNAVVMSWRGIEGGIDAAKQNHDVIMTPGNPVYFDHTQSENEDSVTIGGYNPIEKVYAYEPIPAALNDEQGKHILGAQANLWTEYIGNTKKVEYMIFPRMAALSEVLWSEKDKRNWNDFEKRLMTQFKRYDLWKVNYSKAYYDLKSKVIPAEDGRGVLWQLTSKNPENKIIFTRDINDSKTETYTQPIKVDPIGKYYAAIQNKEGVIISNWIEQQFHINKATGKKITLTTEASSKYPGDGAFTLVNGVINEKGFGRTNEFLGFNGTNCEAIIDLKNDQEISFVVVNTLNRTSSWIWRPRTAEVFGSADGTKWYSLKLTDDFTEDKNGTGHGIMTMAFKKTFARFIKVVITNWGEIPAGNPGSGNKAWLFVDEIEVN